MKVILRQIVKNAYLQGLEDATALGSAINAYGIDELADKYAQKQQRHFLKIKMK